MCIIESTKMGLDSVTRGYVEASQIEINVLKMQIRCGAINRLQIPDKVMISSPIKNLQMTYEGKTLSVRMDDIDIATFEKETTNSSNLIPKRYLPCSIAFEVDNIQIKHTSDGPVMNFTNFQMYGFINDNDNSVDIAIRFDQFKNYLAELINVNMCVSLPIDVDNCIDRFKFSMERAIIVSGYATDEWKKAFSQKQVKKMKKSANSVSSYSFLKMPYANIADVKIMITHRVTVGLELKQTPLTITAFRGRADTTVKDVINYYVKVCVSRVPDFVSNAEVLGINM